MSEALNPSFVKRRSYLVALIRRSSLVSRRSQALIFLLSRYASRFTNDGLLEICFTEIENAADGLLGKPATEER
jgi:hypothetical protein